MTQRCKQIQKDGFHTCGSYAFNLWSEGIDQGSLCDVHYWQQKAQRQWVDLTDEQRSVIIRHHSFADDIIRVTAAKLKELNK
jgi:hypothetical protein